MYNFMRSSSLRLTNTLRFDPNISNLYSSVHNNDFHSSDVQFLFFFWARQVFSSSVFIILSSCFFAAILPFRPASRNLLWTVDVETSVPLLPFNWACSSGAVIIADYGDLWLEWICYLIWRSPLVCLTFFGPQECLFVRTVWQSWPLQWQTIAKFVQFFSKIDPHFSK